MGYLGINADTGASLTGWEHVVQSLRDIFMTRFGARVMREWYGSFVPEALGRNITQAEIMPVISAITSAIEQWEPRYRVIRVEFGGEIRDGRLALTLIGVYRPLALLGSNTEEARNLTIAVTRGSVIMEG